MHELTIAQLRAALDSGAATTAGLVERCLARIREYDDALRAILHVNPRAPDEADRLDEELRRRGPRGPLHGVPVLIKDNFATADMPTTGGCVALEGLVVNKDAFVVGRLREAGAVLLAKTNLHELASGLETISSLVGQTRNPYDTERCAGGSSGGTAAGVAASFAAIGYGTDTRGSIRVPAALTALWGLRPTFGRFSMQGVIPLSHSQDTAGPLARTVADLAAGLDVLGPDPAAGARAGGGEFAAALSVDALRGARVGVLDVFFEGDATEPDVVAIVRDALRAMRGAGAELVPIVSADLETLLDGTDLIEHEFKFDLADFLAATPNAKVHSLGEILERGLHHPSLEQKFRIRDAPAARETEASRGVHAKRARLKQAVSEMMERERLDVLAYPMLRCRPARLGEIQRGDASALSASTGMPAIAMPAGFTADGLPAGLELLGRRGEDARLVGYAYAYEQAVQPRHAPAATPPLRGEPRV